MCCVSLTVFFQMKSRLKSAGFGITSSSAFLQDANKLLLNEQANWVHLKEFARKNAANALSVANMLMGMASILCSLSGHHHAACWLVLIGYLLDLADGAVARQLNACSALGAKLDDFADFTTFGIATSLILRTPSLLDNILCMLNPIHVPWPTMHLLLCHPGVCFSADWRKYGSTENPSSGHDSLHGQSELLPT
ncbi:transmembrane protein 269 isoform X6 [Labeo rohita]|uniref:transmembrane protein 269 isoform X6 n=1 Tax=Labeo rohita TaxID=84645 RepID=UPI0021E2E573|nr:transmembrane protein 269 isoform X6 [Labeo rohita]